MIFNNNHMYQDQDQEYYYITTNLLYEKYITEFIKPIKDDKQYNSEFQKYFNTNLLLNVHLSEEINKSLQEIAIELSKTPIFRYKYNIKRYCELYGRDDIKQTILTNVLEEIKNETSNNFENKQETCNYINNKLECKFGNLDDEIIKQIAFDVLKSAFIVNNGSLKSWKCQEYYYVDNITTDMLYAEYIIQLIEPIPNYTNTNLLLESELPNEINEILMTKAFELSKIEKFQENITKYCKLYGRGVNYMSAEQIAFDVLKSAYVVNL